MSSGKADPTPHFSRDAEATTVEKLGKSVLSGKWGLVSFQRDSVWTDIDILKFFHSLYLGVPVGVVYAWKVRGTDTKSRRTGEYLPPHPARSFSGFEKNFGDGSKSQFLVLDGQQRLTSLSKLRASISDSTYLKPIVVDLEQIKKVDSTGAFKFVKEIKDISSNQVHLQSLLDMGTDTFMATTETDQIYFKEVSQLEKTFTQRSIPVQVLEPWIDNQDALWIFITVNKAGQTLGKLDLAESILRACWQDFPARLEQLVEELQTIYIGMKDAKALTSNGFSIFSKENILRCILFELLGTSDYGVLVEQRKLDVYGTTLKNGQDLSLNELTKAFDKISRGAKLLQTHLKDTLALNTTKGLMKYAIMNGITFFSETKKDGRTDKDVGRILTWIILSSYYTHWNATSPFVALDQTLKLVSADSVEWDNLASIIIDPVRIDKPERVNPLLERIEKDKKTISLEDLIPVYKSGSNDVYGYPFTDKAGFPFKNVILCTLPMYFSSQDWRDGSLIGNTDFNQRTIHHIFPKSKFEADDVVNSLAEIEWNEKKGIGFSDIANYSPSEKERLTEIIRKSLVNGGAKVTGRLEVFREKEKKDGKLPKKDRIKKMELERKIDSINLAISNIDSGDKELNLIDEIQSCTQWWYKFGNKRDKLKNRLGNLSILKQSANSSLGVEWPKAAIFNRYGTSHPERVESQFIPLDDGSIFEKENYSNFCNGREEIIHQKLSILLKSFIAGDLSIKNESAKKVDWIEEITKDNAELKIERKSTAFYDLNLSNTPSHKKSYIVSALVRACVAMANNGGGAVAIGVSDEGHVLGLDHDLEFIKSKYPGASNHFDEYIKMIRGKLDQTEPMLRFRIEPLNHDGKQCLLILLDGSTSFIKQKQYYYTNKNGELGTKSGVYWTRRSGETREFVLNHNKELRFYPQGGKSKEVDDGWELEFDGEIWLGNSKSGPWKIKDV